MDELGAVSGDIPGRVARRTEVGDLLRLRRGVERGGGARSGRADDDEGGGSRDEHDLLTAATGRDATSASSG